MNRDGDPDLSLHSVLAGAVERFEDSNLDRKSTRLNSSHGYISYAVFCLKKKKEISYHLAHITTAVIHLLLFTTQATKDPRPRTPARYPELQRRPPVPALLTSLAAPTSDI